MTTSLIPSTVAAADWSYGPTGAALTTTGELVVHNDIIKRRSDFRGWDLVRYW